jgi:hypothetical protein
MKGVSFMMYAYGQKLSFIHDVDHLHIWIEFKAPMHQDIVPDLSSFLISSDGVELEPNEILWRDAFSLRLTVTDVEAVPLLVLVKFDGPDSALETSWKKNWEPFGWTYAKNLAL